MITSKLFLASSPELAEERKEFEIFVNRKNNQWVDKGLFLQLVLWDDMLAAMSTTRSQDEYNKAIHDCDLFVVLVWTKVGQFTEEEFDVAFSQFKSTQKPFVFTYFKDPAGAAVDASVGAFKSKLQKLGHFRTHYGSIDELKFHFDQQLDKLAANGFIELKRGGEDSTDSTGNGATSKTSVAIAQGPGATAVGARGVLIGGNNTGSINTGTQVHTDGGAYVGGDVKTGRDFVGRDQVNTDRFGINNSKLNAKTINVIVGRLNDQRDQRERHGERKTIVEEIRLDVACPVKVQTDIEFDVAVAIKQPSSPALAIRDLEKNVSAAGILEREAKRDTAKYRVQIKSQDFAIDPLHILFYLRYQQDSEAKWFKLTAKRAGQLSFLVVAYQEVDGVEIASTRVQLDVDVGSRYRTDPSGNG